MDNESDELTLLKTKEENHRIGAVVVTYNPDNKLPERLYRIASQVNKVVVYDNFSNSGSRVYVEECTYIDNLMVIYGEENVGVAKALNLGLDLMQKEGYEWVVTFDQDSWPSTSMVNELLNTCLKSTDPAKVAIVGSNIIDEATPEKSYKWLRQNPKFPFFFERVSSDNLDLENVSIVITSGSLINMSIYQKVGPYIDNLFIDYVDTEFCLRVKSLGYIIIASHNALLYHNLGSRKECRFLNHVYHPTFHKPFRRYYIARNQIFLIKLYGLKFPHWLLFDMIATLYNFYRILSFENDRFLKIKYALIGYWHAVLGKYGKIEI